jgi:hypothetical protein
MDDRDLAPFLRALITVILEPYNTLLGRLLEEGRLDAEELEQLREEVRSLMADLPPVVDRELRKTGWSGNPLRDTIDDR